MPTTGDPRCTCGCGAPRNECTRGPAPPEAWRSTSISVDPGSLQGFIRQRPLYEEVFRQNHFSDLAEALARGDSFAQAVRQTLLPQVTDPDFRVTHDFAIGGVSIGGIDRSNDPDFSVYTVLDQLNEDKNRLVEDITRRLVRPGSDAALLEAVRSLLQAVPTAHLRAQADPILRHTTNPGQTPADENTLAPSAWDRLLDDET